MQLPGLGLTLLCSSFTCFDWVWELSRDCRVLQIPKILRFSALRAKKHSKIICKITAIKHGDCRISIAAIPHAGCKTNPYSLGEGKIQFSFLTIYYPWNLNIKLYSISWVFYKITWEQWQQ